MEIKKPMTENEKKNGTCRSNAVQKNQEFCSMSFRISPLI